MFEKSGSKNGVLRSEAYLTAEYKPEKPVGRERDVQRIARSLKPLARRRQPENLLVYGPAGVGKTTCVKHVFDRLEEETRVKAIYINCWQYDTRSSLLTELLIQLGYPAPRKGKPVDELLSRIREWLDKNRGIAVVLDEFDQLDEKTEVIYDLQLLNEEAEHHTGTILVSNRDPASLKLDPRSESRLTMKTLQFTPYSTKELIDILEHRVEQAFRPGAVPDEVIERFPWRFFLPSPNRILRSLRMRIARSLRSLATPATRGPMCPGRATGAPL